MDTALLSMNQAWYKVISGVKQMWTTLTSHTEQETVLGAWSLDLPNWWPTKQNWEKDVLLFMWVTNLWGSMIFAYWKSIFGAIWYCIISSSKQHMTLLILLYCFAVVCSLPHRVTLGCLHARGAISICWMLVRWTTDLHWSNTMQHLWTAQQWPLGRWLTWSKMHPQQLGRNWVTFL